MEVKYIKTKKKQGWVIVLENGRLVDNWYWETKEQAQRRKELIEVFRKVG